MGTREIKFRAWDRDNKELVYQDANLTAGKVISRFDVLVQFTGLHDKNGKEIYEGDIVRWYWNEINGYGPNAVVSMGTLHGSQDTKCTGWIAEDCFVDSKCEVIGNKFENPEMLNNEYNGHY